MLLDEEIKNYTKPTTKKEARKNIQSFWFNLFDTQQGTIFENLTERTQIVMKLLYQELSAFDKRIRQDIKITFNTDRSRYWKEYITAFPEKKKNKKPALKIRKQKQELKNINEQIEDRTFIQQQQNQQLQAQANLIKQQGDKLEEIKQEQDDIKNDIVSAKDVLNKLLAESGAYGLYQKNMLEQYEKLNYYELKAKRKVAYNELLNELAIYVKQQIQLSIQGERNLPSSLIRDLGELCKSFKEIDTGDKFDVSIPKDIMVAVQNNNNITNNTQINNKQDKVDISNINGIPIGEFAKMINGAQEEKND